RLRTGRGRGRNSGRGPDTGPDRSEPSFGGSHFFIGGGGAGGGEGGGPQGRPLLVVHVVEVRAHERRPCGEGEAEVRDGRRRDARIELAAALRVPHHAGEPLRPLPDVAAHRRGHLLVTAGGDQRLDDQLVVGLAR